MTDVDLPGTRGDSASELSTNLSEMVRVLFGASGVETTLQHVVDLSVSTIDGCDFAGIFVVGESDVTTPVSTDPLVLIVDAAQHRTGEGPCLDAMNNGETVYAEDLAHEHRWPLFGPEAVSEGIRSALAFRLFADGARGSLNLYARYPKAFGVIDRAKGQILAALADVALSSARAHDDEQRRLDNLQAALVSREVIGQAQGILMERERITADQAFDILRRASQHLNTKLRDVAQNLVDTGERPETDTPLAQG